MTTSQDFNNYQAPKDLLKNKTIVVSGAGAGIGRATSLAFAQHGATVVLLGRTLSKLEQVYDEIEALGGPTPAIFPINFSDAGTKDYKDLHQVLEAEFGHIDGLLNNAGELGPRTSIVSYPLEAWQSVIQVNLNAPFLLTQALLPLLVKTEHASVIFTGSGVGLKGKAYWGAYAASKAATENLVQVLADELENKSTVRINSINPGATRTSMRATAFPGEDPTTLKSPEDIVNRYLFLMGEDSKDINGQQLNIQ